MRPGDSTRSGYDVERCHAEEHENAKAENGVQVTKHGGCPVDEPAWMKLMTPISLGRKVVMLHCGRCPKNGKRFSMKLFSIAIAIVALNN